MQHLCIVSFLPFLAMSFSSVPLFFPSVLRSHLHRQGRWPAMGLQATSLLGRSSLPGDIVWGCTLGRPVHNA